MQSDTTFQGYHLPTLAKLCKELNSPTEGELAAFVWRLSNMSTLPSTVAEEFLRSAGYKPFTGYPLTRLICGQNGKLVPGPPADETIIAWTDGGSRGNPGPSAYGVILKRGVSNSPVTQLSKFIGVQTNNVAE